MSETIHLNRAALRRLSRYAEYLLYRDDLELIAPDEAETKQKIVDVMTDGLKLSREKYGRSVRISHAKAQGLLKGSLVVEDGLPTELAQ